jgi:hypothetical protein
MPLFAESEGFISQKHNEGQGEGEEQANQFGAATAALTLFVTSSPSP